jgi:tetratricopeptide (TPR) repeat protein
VLQGYFYDQKVANFQVAPPKPLRVLPFGRNKDFVGRQSQLNRLIAILYTEDTEEDCQRAALVGLGGAGKTQIALEFAFRVQELSPGYSVFWVRASDATSFESAYREIGRQLKISGLDNDEGDVKGLVKAILSSESSGKWIMIVDNADDFEILYSKADERTESHVLHEYLPFSRLGAILFTTRDREAATRYAGSNVIAVEGMDDRESRELLQNGLQNKGLVEDEDSTAKLLKLLVDLPLAIMQAIAYLNAKSATIAEYLRIYQESSDSVIKLLSKDFDDRWRYPDMKNPIATTWLISFKQIQLRDPLAANYMAFMSCINDQDIPRNLLPDAPEVEKTDAIGTLIAFGFIKERLKGESYDIHRLVHIAMQSWLKLNDKLISCNEQTLKQIAKTFPWPIHENRAVWTMYLPHAQRIITSTGFYGGLEEPRWSLCHDVAEGLRIIGKYEEAEQMCRQTLQLSKTVFGAEHRNTIRCMIDLACSLNMSRKSREAEEMHRQLLPLAKEVFGAEHFATLRCINSLANALADQGKYVEAEEMYRQTLQLMEEVVGTEHPNTLRCINNNAVILGNQGKYIEAEEMHRRALHLRGKVLGSEHPETLQSIDNLAAMLRKQGKYIEAKEMHRRVLQLREKVLGAEHPETLESIHNLAAILTNQGKYIEAKEMDRRVLQLREKVLGAEHPETLESIHNLANVLRKQGKHKEAEKMYRQALKLRKEVLGAEHPDTLSTMNNLAVTIDNLGRYVEAEELYKHTVELRERLLGTEHPETLRSKRNLAQLQRRMKRMSLEKKERPKSA